MAKPNVIELKNVVVFQPEDEAGRLSWRNAQQVLSDVNISVGEGEMVYFIGRVGSGKSSLLKTLYAELPLLEGEGEIVGFDLGKLRRRDVYKLRRKIGIVFQDYQLLTDRNVYDNLRFVMRATGWKGEADIAARIEEVLEVVGLRNKEYKMPFELSGGEQQRLVIARALVNSPKVILADEPTGNLDPRAADEIMELFRRIVEGGCSIVMSTHNIANIEQYPSRTFRFAKGRVEEIDIKAVLAN
ncbi:MAG: ATP-binding cassette domain-containing protein [Tidjanibacter sp.]|nr:ATP-binding cassette domain-containing protein [Tidjanibacter sp.]